jgi:hypothetical protein
MNTDKGIHASGGGAATQSGINYQNQVAAWLCVHVLAEQDVTPPWGLPQDVTLEFIRCETEQPVDDLLVGTSQGGHAFVQVKHTVTSAKGNDSALASALDQFVRQFTSCRSKEGGKHRWERPLDAGLDRLVLVTSSKSSAPVREHLPAVLARLRALAPGQSIDDAAANKEERKILAILRGHLGRIWSGVMGAAITEAEELELLRLLRVQILDFEGGELNEREGKNQLRSSIVENPAQADATWNTLVTACAGYGARRSGADRPALQQHLLASHINIKAPRSYRSDIKRLRQQSASTLEALQDLSTIRVGKNTVKIQRPSSEALRRATEEDSIVVVGEPGAGKSGTLHDLVEALSNEKRDVVFLAVDRLQARSLGELRQELGLQHEIVEVLRNWPGDGSGYLIVDALDAARSEASAQTCYDLLASLLRQPKRWRVVVSIRKFDLRHNTKLQQLFAGRPPTKYRSPEFSNLSHLNVPLLDEVEEWGQINQQAPELGSLFVKAGEGLRALLLVPFNVRLAGELLGSGVSVESLSPIETQIDLLDRYWQERVIRADHQGNAREVVLTRAVEIMVKARSLRADRREVAAEPALGEPLDDVLSSQILSEWEPSPGARADRSVLTFAHHVLFDYAVARLLLRGTERTLIERLEREADVVMAIRPSVVMHFQHEWLRDEVRFWDAVFRVLRSEKIPEIGKLIGPMVAVESAKVIDGFEPLVSALSSEDVKRREVAEKALRHLTGALLVAGTSSKGSLVGLIAPNWAGLMDRCMTETRAAIAYSVRPVLLTICMTPEALTDKQRHSAGRVARRLLDFALAREPRDSMLVLAGIEAVCRTFESDPAASAEILRRCLDPEHVLKFGHEELFHLGNEMERLIKYDPALVEDIYRAAFTLYDASPEKTSLGGSRILALSSTRKQDFDMARFVLSGKYKQFLEQAPLHATRALLASLSTYDEWRHASRSGGEQIAEKFEFYGRTAYIETDYSEIWDDGTAHHGEPQKMLDVFQNYLEQIGASGSDDGELRRVLDLLAAENREAVVWRRLLTSGAKLPQTLGYEVRSLSWVVPILLNYDTSRAAGDFLKTVFTHLTPMEREQVERAILSVPTSAGSDVWADPEYLRNRLLGCLDRESLMTEEAKALISQLEAEQGVPANEPLFTSSGVITGVYTDEDYLRDQGVAVEEERSRRVLALSAPAKEFAANHLNTAPTREEVDQVMPALRTLRNALETAETDGVHKRQCDMVWGHLAEACRATVELENFSCGTEDGSFVRSVLVEAAAYPDPPHRPDSDNHFDSHPSWGSPAARIDAARGVIRLARHAACADPTVVETVERLAHDEVPAVRYQVAINLRSLYYTAPDLMWTLLEGISREDKSRGVLQGMLVGSLHALAAYHPARVTDCVRSIFARVREGDGAAEVRRRCAAIFLGLYLWQKEPACAEIIDEIVRDPSRYDSEAHQIIFSARDWLNLGRVDPPNHEHESVRRGAFDVLERMLRAARDGIRALEEKYGATPFVSWNEADQENGTKLARVVEDIGTHVYFVSGAYKDVTSDQAGRIPLGVQERTRFLREALGILKLLSEFGYPSLNHHLLETLEFFIPFSPEEVFLLVGRVVRSGRQGGYEYESMAVELIVRLVERFIAEFRYVLQENEECRRTLIEILDTFVEAGWASARRLTYRMEEIFR